MRILATLISPTRGHVFWEGVDVAREPNRLRAVLGYLPQNFGVYETLSAREFLAYMAAIKGLPDATAPARVDECLEMVGLADAADERLAGFSGGMRQRVGIAQALLNDPKLLIVDEPTVGLDPEERLRFRNLLTDLAGERLVILSTHIVSDVEASTTALAVLDKGRLRFNGAPEQLMELARGSVWTCTLQSNRLAQIRARYPVSHSIRQADGVKVRVIARDRPDESAEPIAPDLEDAYTWLLTKSARG
jgi:ABC-2 type transport system ATP-binding protein